MNIHPQTVTCQQGPKNHFQYNPDLSFTLKDSAASASLSGWWDKKTTCSLVRLFMCTCPAWRPKSKNSPPSTNLTNLHQTQECTHACSDLPDYLGQFNHWSEAEWDFKVLCKFRHWFHFISPWKRKLLAPSYLVLNLSFQPATAPVSPRDVSSSDSNLCARPELLKSRTSQTQCSFQV